MKTKDDSVDSKPRFRKVGQVIEGEFQRIEDAISKGSFKIWGEVIKLYSDSNGTHCQIRDKDLLKSMQVRLPVNAEIKLGDYILVAGSLTTTSSANGSAALVVTGVIEKKFISSRLRAVNEAIKILETNYTPRTLPEGPLRRIAVVTGHKSKAPADFRAALARGKPLDVDIVHAWLSNPVDVASAIKSAALADIDLLVVTRGGGDTIMLAVFDEPEVLTALAEASHRTPVILAVGHATDTLRASRFVTLSCTTPSAAGTRVRNLHNRKKSETVQRNPRTPATRGRRLKWFAMVFVAGTALGCWLGWKAAAAL